MVFCPEPKTTTRIPLLVCVLSRSVTASSEVVPKYAPTIYFLGFNYHDVEFGIRQLYEAVDQLALSFSSRYVSPIELFFNSIQ